MNMLSNNAPKKEPEISPKITEVAMSKYLTEQQYTNHVLNELRNVDWVKPLISKIATNGDITNTTNIPLLFEARYAYEIHCRNIQAQYEYKTGVGESTVDFRCMVEQQEWFIELVSILPSQAGQQAIHEFIQPGMKLPDGIETYEQTFDTNANNSKMSEEGEILLAEQKIGGKVFANGQPIKFPIPSNAFHVIVADMRGMLGFGGGRSLCHDDYLEIAYGSKRASQREILSRRWPPQNGKPIVGLFEKDNPFQSAKYIQERIHFIDFVCEGKYEEGEIIQNTFGVENPFLFPKNINEAGIARSSHPLFYKEI